MQRKGVGSDGPQRLAAIEFFSGLGEAHRRMLARLVDALDAEPGDVLMNEGDPGYEAVFVEDGSAEVRQAGETVNTVGAGEIVGELALLGSDGRKSARGCPTSRPPSLRPPRSISSATGVAPSRPPAEGRLRAGPAFW